MKEGAAGAAPPEVLKARPPACAAPSVWGAVDASERASDLFLRAELFFIKYLVRVSQKSCRATGTKERTI